MKLECCNFDVFSKRILADNKRLVLFGAGAIGSVVTPEILKEWKLLGNVDYYLDNDKSKWGKRIEIYEKKIIIQSPEYLERCPRDTIIILNISRFSDVVEQLEHMECTREMTCYIMPMMLIHNFCLNESEGACSMATMPLIPKKLHYMWLGRKQLPDNLKRCMESWRKYCPDYEIIEWNEDNYDIEKHIYMKQAYEVGAYGFVPDYARLDILYNEGGIYLDTDVEIKRNIDDLLYQSAFCGVEKWQILNFGGMSGAVKGHPMIKEFLDARKDIEFLDECGNQNRNTCGYYDTKAALKKGYRINGRTQSVEGMNIYASDYFHPYDYMSGIANITNHTYSSHWFNGGWLDEEMKQENEAAQKRFLEVYRKSLNEL